jgi:hypothetical protein
MLYRHVAAAVGTGDYDDLLSILPSCSCRVLLELRRPSNRAPRRLGNRPCQQVIRSMSCDEHVKSVAYDTEVPSADADGPSGCTYVATLAASGLLQVRVLSAAGELQQAS